MITTLLAQIKNPVAPKLSPITDVQGVNFFGSLIQQIVAILLIVGSLAFFFMFVLGAIKWIMSGGDKASIEGARNQITHALVGLIILLSIFAIIKLIETVFGVCILQIDLGPLKIDGGSTSNLQCGLTPVTQPPIEYDPGSPNRPGITR